MSHFGAYMDGVSVKISEKYKRPPRIELPYSVIECPSRAKNVVESAEYCCQFENNVLGKLKELRAAKETRRSERRHRLQLLEEGKQRKLDAIAAAEAAEKLKQLSVSEVSYPSTEEISEISPDDTADNCDTLTQEPEHFETTTIYPTCSNADSNILQPIQVQSNYQPHNLLDDPDPLKEYKMPAKPVKAPQYNAYKQDIDTLTFKDFENDTSSPFDNVELKTINDMEQLAQVLQGQREQTGGSQPQYAVEQSYISNCASQAQIQGITYLPNTYLDAHSAGVMYAPNYTLTNGYYIPNNTCDNVYMPNYQDYIPNQYADQYYQLPQASSEMPLTHESSYIPQQYYYYPPAPQVPYQYQNQTYVPQHNETHSTSSQNTIKSRSRSVPDIVRELDEEITQAKLRAKERSCNASPLPKEVKPSTSSKRKKEKARKDQLPNPYDKLSPSLQGMCQKISGMGFPLDRVARVCTLVGDNDKKIIEGLLILGELIDLGFSEGRVSAALAKHEFNRDKALDELVA